MELFFVIERKNSFVARSDYIRSSKIHEQDAEFDTKACCFSPEMELASPYNDDVCFLKPERVIVGADPRGRPAGYYRGWWLVVC